MTASNKMNI